MSDNKKIDILMATYNGEKYLKAQIESILNQTYKNINLIISDDCSTDNTRQILKKYEENDNIQIYYQKENLGSIRNFEFLLSKVENELYMLSDQDDIWLDNKVEETLNNLEKEDADLVFTDLEVVDENLNIIDKSFNRKMGKIHKIQKTLKTDELEYLYNNITGCTIMSKKEFISKILPFPKDSKYIIHDSWIGLIVSLNGKISYLDKPLIKYRQHGDNQIGTQRESFTYKKFNQIRELFINVKKDLFKTYIENQEKFPSRLKELNIKGKMYFDDIENKKNANFKNWAVFHALYKNESTSYYVINFIILNLPFLGKGLFNIYFKLKNNTKGENVGK